MGSLEKLKSLFLSNFKFKENYTLIPATGGERQTGREVDSSWWNLARFLNIFFYPQTKSLNIRKKYSK